MPTILVDLTALNTDSRFRGTGRYVRDLALGLARLDPSERSGLQILGLTSYDWAGHYEITEDLASFTGHPDKPSPRDRFGWAYKRRWVLWRVARAVGASVVHLGDPSGTPLGLRANGTRFVLTCHDLIDRHFPERYVSAIDGGKTLANALQRRRHERADLVVAISDATRDDLVRFLDLPRAKIERVYNGVDIERWSQPDLPSTGNVAARYGLADKAFLLYVGDTDWRKNVEGMMAGLARAIAQGVRVRLAFAGGLSPNRAADVDATAARYGVAGDVIRLGYVPDVDLRALYRAARANLFVSRIEGFGLPVVEAMAAGCPVITTTCGSLREVAGDAALLVDPDDHPAIGIAIERACRDDALRAALIARGHVQAAKFSLENQARAMVAVYRKAADLRP